MEDTEGPLASNSPADAECPLAFRRPAPLQVLTRRSARRDGSQVAILFLMLSHHVCDAHLPAHCDDLACRLTGQFSAPARSALATGIMWTDVNALNCFVAEGRKLYYLEPQNDAAKGHLDPWQGATIRFVPM